MARKNILEISNTQIGTTKKRRNLARKICGAQENQFVLFGVRILPAFRPFAGLPCGLDCNAELEPSEEFRQSRFQALGDFFDIDQRDVPNTAFYSGVIRSVKAATLRSFLLNDALFLADATDCATKPDANIERHWI